MRRPNCSNKIRRIHPSRHPSPKHLRRKKYLLRGNKRSGWRDQFENQECLERNVVKV